MNQNITDETSRIYGCLIGGWCGDAAGATLEFCSRTITEEMVDNAMKMPGGGVFNVGPGQITDDSELELSTLNAIANTVIEHKNTKNKTEIPLTQIAKGYIEWFRSNPFDIGNTCSRAFRNAENINDVLNNSSTLNTKSVANGAMMRSAALAIWARKAINDQTIFDIGRYDAILSHPNDICQEINGLYYLIIAKLIKGYSPVYILDMLNSRMSRMSSEIKNWFDEASSLENINCTTNIGFVKHAFMLVIYFLKQSCDRHISYEDAIKTVLLKGGDTDTNAKIVGNVMGALHGINDIPAYMIGPVLDFDCTKNGNIRPKQYSVKENTELIKYL